MSRSPRSSTSCGRNSGLSRLGLGEGLLAKDLLLFRPADDSRYAGHRDLTSYIFWENVGVKRRRQGGREMVPAKIRKHC